MKITAILTILLFSFSVIAAPPIMKEGSINIQAVSIGDSAAADSKSLLDIKSTTRGVLFPRMTTTQMNAIASPTTGLMIWNTTASTLYQYTGSAWAPLDGYPSQSGNSGKYLTTNGTVTSWASVDALPTQTGNSGKYLTTNGTASSWSLVSVASGITGTLPIANGGTGQTSASSAFDALAPSQGSNSGKFLTTNGTTTSWGTAALTAQGQSEGAGVTTTTIKAPENQFTTIASNTRLLETGNKNLLVDPGFEGTAPGTPWNTAGNGTTTVESTVVFDGKQSMKQVVSAIIGTLMHQVVTPTQQITGAAMEASIRIKVTGYTGGTGQVCFLGNDYSDKKLCVPLVTDGNWKEYKINYPGLANMGLGVDVTSFGGTLYYDDAYVGLARNIGTVAQTTQVGDGYFPTTASCTWSRTNTAIGAFSTTAACPGPTILNNVGPGVIQTTDANLPKFTVNDLPAGLYEVQFYSDVTGDNAANSSKCLAVNDGTTTSPAICGYIDNTQALQIVASGSFNYSSAGNRSFELYGSASANAIVVEAQNANRTLYFKITRYPNSNQTVTSMAQARAPTVQKFTSGSGTYTTPTGVTHIEVRMVGGGGGGAGSGTASGSAAGVGGNSTFGSSLLTANGGTAGAWGSGGGQGGSASLGTGPIGTAISGSYGGGSGGTAASNVSYVGGNGGSSSFGGAGGGGGSGQAGSAGITNSGSGGGGGGIGGATGANSGGGGGSGGFVHARIYGAYLSSTFSYAVGAGGSSGGAGTSGFAGGAGGSGYIEVTEYYAWDMPIISQSVITDSPGVSPISYFRISTSGAVCSGTPCTVDETSASGIFTATRSTAGRYGFAIASGKYSSKPKCWGGPQDNSTHICAIGATSATAGFANCNTDSGTPVDEIVEIICIGPR